MHARTDRRKRDRERKRKENEGGGGERESVENQTTWSTPATRSALPTLSVRVASFSLSFSLRVARLSLSLFCPFARPTFHVSLTKAHATIYSHFAPRPRGDFSSFCHNFGIIKIYVPSLPHRQAGPYVFPIPYQPAG